MSRTGTRAMRTLATFSLLCSAMAAGFGAPASAQATRTWVSGVGDDANPCSRTAPCKTFAGAISKTAAGGEINALDSGGFGGVTITKSITIDGGPGTEAGVLVSGSNGIIINVTADPTNSVVVLRNLDIFEASNPSGCGPLDGIRVLNGHNVVIDKVNITGFANGVGVGTGTGGLPSDVNVSIRNTSITGNSCGTGVAARSTGAGKASVSLDTSAINATTTGLSVDSGSEAWVSGTNITHNGVALQGPGPIHSLCGNSFANNTTASSFTDVACDTTAAPTNPTPGLTSCTVPYLRRAGLAAAASSLASNGCTLGNVRGKRSKKSLRHGVKRQSIPAGTIVPLGTAVSIRFET